MASNCSVCGKRLKGGFIITLSAFCTKCIKIVFEGKQSISPKKSSSAMNLNKRPATKTKKLPTENL